MKSCGSKLIARFRRHGRRKTTKAGRRIAAVLAAKPKER